VAETSADEHCSGKIVSIVSAKYDWNWSTVGKVITKIIYKGELFIGTQCIQVYFATRCIETPRQKNTQHKTQHNINRHVI